MSLKVVLMKYSMQHINSAKKRLITREEGITVVELILVCIFSLFVLGLTYQLIFMAQSGATYNEKNTRVAEDAGTVLDIFDRYLSQNIELSSVGPYEFSVEIPEKESDGTYPVTFKAYADGRLTMTRTFKGATEELLLSKNNANQAANVDFLSSFVDSIGSEIPPGSSIDFEQVRAVKVTVVIKNPAPKNSADAYLSSSRIIYFRNR